MNNIIFFIILFGSGILNSCLIISKNRLEIKNTILQEENRKLKDELASKFSLK